jgi:hypothetical protein
VPSVKLPPFLTEPMLSALMCVCGGGGGESRKKVPVGMCMCLYAFIAEHIYRGHILRRNLDEILRLLFAPCYSQSPPPANCYSPIRFQGLEVSTATAESRGRLGFFYIIYLLNFESSIVNEENLSWFMNSTVEKDKNEGRNHKSEKSQDYARKPQNCTFMNSVSV